MQPPIYLISNKHFEGVHTLPLTQTHFLTPTPQEWIHALQCEQWQLTSLPKFLSDFVLIFSSQKAIEALERLGIPLKRQRAFVVGAKTQDALIKRGGILMATPQQSYGANLIQTIQESMPKTQRAIYFRAKKSFREIACILNAKGYHISELALYETIENPQPFIAPPQDSIIIFTAPSGYQSFIKRFEWNPSYKAIAIGKSTFESFNPQTQQNAMIAQDQTLESCITLAQAISHDTNEK